MKKAILFFAIGLLVLGAAPSFSQTTGYPKEAYVKSIPISKILIHPLGYQIIYFRSDFTFGKMYIPLSWFGVAAGKAEMIWGNEPAYPYVSIFWVDGKFDHVSIHVIDSYSDPSWGVLSSAQDLSAQFNVQEPPKDF
jgi:hypothetical protein